MDTGVRIAMTLGSIDDYTSVEAGVLAVKEVTTDVGEHHLVLHVSDSNNGFVPAKNEISDDIDDVLNNIISRPQKDDIFVSDLDKTYETELSHVEVGTITTSGYYRRIIINMQTLINMDEVVKPLNKNERGWATLEIVDKRGAVLTTREWNFYEMTGGDYKDGMIIGSDDNTILFDQDYDVPVKATFKYNIPVGEYTGKNVYGDIRTIPCLKSLKLNFTAKRVTTDNEFLDPSLQFMCKFDSNGNYSYASEDVIRQFKEEYRANYDKYKPYILETSEHGVTAKVIPWLSEHMVFTELTFENEEFKNLGKLIEKMIKVIVRDQNNIFVRANTLYKGTTNFIKKHMEENAVQELKLLDIWSQIATMWSNVLAIDEWTPKIDVLKPLPVVKELDLRSFEPDYMYKYKFIPDKKALLADSDTDHWEPVLWFHGLSPTDNSHMDGMCSSTGQLMSGHINKSELTDYVRKLWNVGVSVPGLSTTFRLDSGKSPASPIAHITNKLGNDDTLYSSVSGTLTFNQSTRVPLVFQSVKPWVEVYIECYNTSGTLMKTVTATFNGGGTRSHISFDSANKVSVSFSANLNGKYHIKIKPNIYYGTFANFPDSKALGNLYNKNYDSLGWGAHHGLWECIFDGTRSGEFAFNYVEGTNKIRNGHTNHRNGTFWVHVYGYDTGGKEIFHKSSVGYLQTYGAGSWGWQELKWNVQLPQPAKIKIYTDGQVGDPKGDNSNGDNSLDIGQVLNVTLKNVGASVPGSQASNYPIVDSVSLSISATGDTAYYVTEQYKTPSFFFPQDGEYTVLLRGARSYQFISSLPMTFIQMGTIKVDVGTFTMSLSNTTHYGQVLYKNQDVIVNGRSRSYKIKVSGSPDSETIINSGAPHPDMRTALISKKRSARSVLDKPENEYGVGQLSVVDIPYGSLFTDGQNHDIYLLVTDSNGDVIEIPVQSYDYTNYISIYNDNRVRVYMRIENSTVYLMTYGINVRRAEFVHRTKSSLEFQLIDIVTKEVSKSFPLSDHKETEHSLTFEISGKEYYINISDEPTEDEEEPIKIFDKDNRMVGYLSK